MSLSLVLLRPAAILPVAGLLAVMNSASSLAAAVQSTSRPIFGSMDNFAAYSGALCRSPSLCFNKTSSGFEWMDPCLPLEREPITCGTVCQSSAWGQDWPASFVDKSALLMEKDDTSAWRDCNELNTAIIRSHVDSALHGKLSEKSAYSSHHAYRYSDEYGCFPIGDLSWVNSLSLEQREDLSALEITICPAVDSKKTPISDGRYQILSATVFGKSQEYKDVCFRIFSHHFRNIKSEEL